MAVAEEAVAVVTAGAVGDMGPEEKDVCRHGSPWFLGTTYSIHALAGPRLPHVHTGMFVAAGKQGRGAVQVVEGHACLGGMKAASQVTLSSQCYRKFRRRRVG